MKVSIEMDNGKNYKVDYKESLEFFLQEVQFAQANPFIQADDGTYLSIKKIVQFKPE